MSFIKAIDNVKAWQWSHEKCRTCGMLRVNVIHEQHPETAPEGPDYYEPFLDQLHEFQRSGEFED